MSTVKATAYVRKGWWMTGESLFVCLFVCWDKTRNSILCSLCLEGSNNPWEWLHTESGTEIELYPRQSCFQHENRPENTPRPRAWHKEHCGADLIRHGPRVRTLWRRFNQTRTTCINQWLTLYKLTGWYASLDLRKPYTDASSTTELTTPYALLFCCRGKFAINHKRFGG